MGEFVLDKSFSMLHNKGTHYIINSMQSALSLLGPCGPVPWVAQLGLKLRPPLRVLRDWRDTVSWCEEQMREQLEVTTNARRHSNGALTRLAENR